MTTKITKKVLGSQAVETANLKDLNVTTGKLADGSITTAKYAAASVNNDALGTDSVDSRVLAALAVTDANVNDVSAGKITGTLTSSQIDSLDATKITGFIQGPQIGTGALVTSNYGAGSVNTSALADGAAVTAKLADAAVTYAKMQTGTNNALIMHGATGVVRALAPGAESSILTIVGGVPSWSGSIIPVGFIGDYFGNGAPQGWVNCNGTTIGNTSSAATGLASLQAQTLFYYLWASFADSICPVVGGRGASSAADWSANKTITLPDLRGRSTVGVDTSTAPAGHITAALTPANTTGSVTTVGHLGGTEKVTLDITQVPAHKHLLFGVNATGGLNSNLPSSTNTAIVRNAASTDDDMQYSATYSEATVILSGTAGGSSGTTQPVNKMTPFLLVSKIMKL